jgi:hypothetical protein
MKFIKIHESNAHGNPNLYEMHLGLEEMELILGWAINFYGNSPKIKRYLPDNNRAKNIIKTIKKLL